MSFFKGLISGVILTGIIFWKTMPKMMLRICKSNYDVDETVSIIEESAKKLGWTVPKIYNIQETLGNAGFKDMRKIKILSICQPEHAYKILKNDADKKVAAIMPCRVGVYEDSKGNVFVAGMNIGLMSRMFGGNIAKVMGTAAREEHEIVSNAIYGKCGY
jgi:uncharacterized protein (DUF302 family)